MTITAPTKGPAGDQAVTEPSIGRLLVEHKHVSLAVLAAFVVLVASILPEVVSAGTWTVTDSTSCTAWSSANPKQQAAYSRLYVRQHGSLANGATSPASIVAAVNKGCLAAFAYDEDDQVTVLHASKGRY